MSLSVKVALCAIVVGVALKFLVGAPGEAKLTQPTNAQVTEGAAAMVRAQGKIQHEVDAGILPQR